RLPPARADRRRAPPAPRALFLAYILGGVATAVQAERNDGEQLQAGCGGHGCFVRDRRRDRRGPGPPRLSDRGWRAPRGAGLEGGGGGRPGPPPAGGERR